MAVDIPFVKDLQFSYGQADQLTPLVRRVICRNPGPFTLFGTGTYIVGNGNVAIIDPGPANPEHIQALLAATQGEHITHILVTHTHSDHSPGCALLQQHCDAQTWAMGPHGLGKIAQDATGGGDFDFVPDRLIVDGQLIKGDGWEIACIYTPGHSLNHMSFALPDEQVLLCGDVVMGWSTTIVSPPDGNMKDYMVSLERLLQRQDITYYPAHGAPIQSPQKYVESLHAHRMQRITQVLDCIETGTTQVMEMVPIIYAELEVSMYPAAAQSVLASIEYLLARGAIHCVGQPSLKSSYHPA